MPVARIAVAALLLAAATLPAAAAQYSLVMTNQTEAVIEKVTLSAGKIVDFKKVPANGKRSFTVEMPDGVCVADVRMVFADNDSVSQTGYDVCGEEGVSVGLY